MEEVIGPALVAAAGYVLAINLAAEGAFGAAAADWARGKPLVFTHAATPLDLGNPYINPGVGNNYPGRAGSYGINPNANT